MPMKKVMTVLLLLLAALLLVGCSWFESAPVKPKILGVEHIVQERGLIYVQIDSVRYSVTSVWSGEKSKYEGQIYIKPVDGMLITIAELTGDDRGLQGLHYFLGEWNEEEIEAYFHRDYTFMVCALTAILLCVLGMGFFGYLVDKKRVEKFSALQQKETTLTDKIC